MTSSLISYSRSDYRARYYDANAGRFISEDPQRYEFTSLYSYVGENPVLWQDPLGLWKCKNGDCGGLNPGLKDSLDLFEKCTGLDITVTCGTSGHPPTIDKNGIGKADPHFWGAAVDIGHNTNPGLSMPLFKKCFDASFPRKDPPTRTWGSYAQPEWNASNPDGTPNVSAGWHYHIQYFGGARGGQGFQPFPTHPHGH